MAIKNISEALLGARATLEKAGRKNKKIAAIIGMYAKRNITPDMVEIIEKSGTLRLKVDSATQSSLFLQKARLMQDISFLLRPLTIKKIVFK